MRVPHALAAVAAFGALVYGVSDPLNSALAARTTAKESTRVAVQAQAAAKAPATIPAAQRTQALVATKPAAKAAAAKSAAKSVAKPAAKDPDLTEIARERDQHRATQPKAEAAKPAQAAKPAAVSKPAVVSKPAPPKPAVRTTPRRTPSRAVPTVTPKVVSAQESYGSAASQRVTVSRLSTAAGKRPTVYFVHGGSWIGGSSTEWQAEANRWAAQGWTAVNISYRVNVPGRFMLGDVRTVVSDFERRPYVNAGKQIIVGSSAGGHLATSIAVRYPKEFKGVIAWSPVISPQVAAAQATHTSQLGSKYRLAQAARRLWGSNWHSATPVSYVSRFTPPLWAAAARGEWLRWTDQGELLCDALGPRCTATIIPGASHGAQLAQSHPALRQRALAWATAQVR